MSVLDTKAGMLVFKGLCMRIDDMVYYREEK